MLDVLVRLIETVDRAVVAVLLPVAVWILVSGLDDLFVLLAFLRARLSSGREPSQADLRTVAPRRIAVFIPCWREDAVIGSMVEHNISAIRYRNYDLFVGAYPNDEATITVIRGLEERFEAVHLCLCPDNGPTSKADCLNWIYQRMLLYEEEQNCRFEVALIHDAEDLIHADELDWVNYYTRSHDFVQTPVLPLRTPLKDFTHGLYCDDFAEGHTKDLVARQSLGGFIPSCGVGTGYKREALEKLASAESNRVFEPSCLTEDYENGLRLHLQGAKQMFMPLRFRKGIPVATREYFPGQFSGAVKQRTRWVTGISLQTWQRHGFRGGWRQLYWLCRDRKGVIGNPVSLLANLLFFYGLVSWAATSADGAAWGFGMELQGSTLFALLAVNCGLQILQLGVRTVCVARIYGLKFALGVPFRTLYGNCLNTVSTGRAVYTFARAQLKGVPLVWVKTEHAYPSKLALLPHKRPLEEILVGSRYLTAAELETARRTKPRGVRLAEHLVISGLLDEEDLYEALSLQLGLALGKIEPIEVSRNVARCLPAHIVREWNVLPVRIEGGSMHLASPDVPSEELREVLRRFTRLDIRVEVVTPTNFRRLAEAFL